MRYKLISIIIATYNSQRILPLSLESVKKQTYPQNRLEILIIDGGSTDQTIKIARKFGCKIISNPKREPLFAKYLGFIKARGDYILYLDSDEVMENPDSLMLKYLIFKKDKNIGVVIPSGYKVPPGYSSINFYINEFGDPFSFFIYRLSKDANHFTKELLAKYKKIYADKSCVIFNFGNIKLLPFLEFGAMGIMTNLCYLKKNVKEIKKHLFISSFMFYTLNSQTTNVAIAKNDLIYHYSSDTFGKYLKKIKSRVINNVFQTAMGKAGFSGRDQFQPIWFRFKRYLFIPYSLTLLFPLVDAIYFSISRKRSIYLIHPFLCIYTCILIIYYYFLKLLNRRPQILSYGN
ncbi:hypothetical protein A3B45_00375 [Candidatus Daviesbacteria bacterium RIFCSPLOWO2_01_FULL_39_12]|uniref:Glycosyltransferase 2-like domain-containing protein n=1 Tax=Candidatus Daviesbacteria bacterium RIFCSPLOWO2_01_FULL_39_12 TaxID=1797785 RepID=A0A1F5KPC3_9BACT|nr:MAG: hypothetical protein A3B45_00375 [Candidatus Daviesbacteria bacterium RIFCSPLOWO2_01_FULL_39_12]